MVQLYRVYLQYKYGQHHGGLTTGWFRLAVYADQSNHICYQYSQISRKHNMEDGAIIQSVATSKEYSEDVQYSKEDSQHMSLIVNVDEQIMTSVYKGVGVQAIIA